MTTESLQAVDVVIEDLNLSFGDTPVLKGVNLSIRGGEFFAFLGPSGSGKSTLLRAIAGFGPTPTGRILIGGEDIAGRPPWTRNVGMVFQSYALWPHMTVRKNVAFGLEERKIPKKQINDRVDQALDMVGLAALAERRPSQLSGGQQQRIALARTIVVEPKVLLLDEPLSNLDANLRIQMRREIRDLQRKLELTTIFVTHDQEEANTTSDRMAVLDQGVIQQIGSPMDLYDHPDNLFVAKFLGTANVIDGLIEGNGHEAVFRSSTGFELSLGVKERGRRSIVLRPQNLNIAAVGTSAHDARTRLSGAVRHMEFLGSIVRYAVEIGKDTILIDHPHKQGEATFPTDAQVDLFVDQEQILVLKA